MLRAAPDPLLKPFSKVTRELPAKALGLQSLEATNVQYALKALAARNVLFKPPCGVSYFDYPAFQFWMKTLGL